MNFKPLFAVALTLSLFHIEVHAQGMMGMQDTAKRMLKHQGEASQAGFKRDKTADKIHEASIRRKERLRKKRGLENAAERNGKGDEWREEKMAKRRDKHKEKKQKEKESEWEDVDIPEEEGQERVSASVEIDGDSTKVEYEDSDISVSVETNE